MSAVVRALVGVLVLCCAFHPVRAAARGRKTTTTTTSTTSTTTTTKTTTTTTSSTTTTTKASTTSTTTTPASTTTTTTSAVNQPPVANAGPDRSGTVNVAVSFDGSLSYDPDGTIAAYWWTWGDGSSSTVATPGTSHTYTTTGTFNVVLWVQDNKGAWSTTSDFAVATIGTSATTTTTIATTTTTTKTTTTTTASTTTTTKTTTTVVGSTTTTTVADVPPTANAGGNKSGAPGQSITFSGSGSYDPDGSITGYAWAFGDGATATGMTVTHAYAATGSYTATLTVTDNLGLRGTDNAAVVVATTWAAAIGGTDNDGTYNTATNAAGDVAVVGQFRGSMRLSPTVSLTSAGLADGFVAKYSSGGVLQWARALGGTGDDSLEGVAFDPTNGDVVVVGRFAGTVNFGGTQSYTASGASDIVLARYDGATGAHKWSNAWGSAYDDSGDAVTVDPGGNMLITGYFKGSINFGGSTLTVPFGTDLDVFVAKFNGAGAHQWSKNFTNTGNDRGYAIATDSTGNVALAGWFTNAINFGGTQLFASNSVADAFVAKFTSAGTHVWSRQIGSTTAEEQAYGVAFDAASDVIVCGYAIAPVDFGGGVLTSYGNADGWVASYASANGAHQWSRRVGGAGNDYANAVAVAANGDVVLTGSFEQTGAFGGTSIVVAGGTDAFVARYTNAGAPLWARAQGGLSNDIATAVAMSGNYPVIAGYFAGTGTFDSTTITSSGLNDGFLARIAP